MKKFALAGVAGFVAPRHLEAIRVTGNELVAAMDRSDSVGILDHYFPAAHFFSGLEGLRQFLESGRKNGNPVDYFSVCTPNHLHDEHVRFGLNLGASVICEKPLVLDPSEAEALLKVQEETGREVFNILQLRLQPDIVKLKEQASLLPSSQKTEIDLAYITPRGKWYHSSWKGDKAKSGGIATNIGIHFFDMLIWIFGKVQQSVVHLHDAERAAGFLELERARVRWFLSIREEDLPRVRDPKQHAYRFLSMGTKQVDFSSGFSDLHTRNYEAILAGYGFKLAEALPSLDLAHRIRMAKPVGLKGDFHPMANINL